MSVFARFLKNCVMLDEETMRNASDGSARQLISEPSLECIIRL